MRGQGPQDCSHMVCFCGFMDGSSFLGGSHFQQFSVGNAFPVGFQKLVPWLPPPLTFCLHSGCFGAPVLFPWAKACLPAHQLSHLMFLSQEPLSAAYLLPGSTDQNPPEHSLENPLIYFIFTFSKDSISHRVTLSRQNLPAG